MLKGFKDFIMRGNLVELAVAFVMGGAFATVVTATVAMIMDLVGKIGGTPNFSKYKPAGIHVGDWLTALVSFLILAAVVYFVVMVPYNKLQSKIAKGKAPAPPAADIALLTEIRDILAGGQRGTDHVSSGNGQTTSS